MPNMQCLSGLKNGQARDSYGPQGQRSGQAAARLAL